MTTATKWTLTLIGLGAAFLVGQHFAPAPAGSDEAGVPEAFEQSLTLRDPLERVAGISGAMQRMSAGDLAAVRALVEAHEVALTRDEVRLFMLAWSRFDPAGAWSWADAWPSDWRDVLLTEAAYAWATADPPAAMAAVGGIEDDALREQLSSLVLDGWTYADDRSGLSAHLAATEGASARGRMTFRLAAEIMREGSDAVFAWAEAIPDDAPNDFKAIAAYHACAVVAAADPQPAARWYERHRDQPYTQRAAIALARRWALMHDAEEAFAWLDSLPEPRRNEESIDAVHAAFRAWQRRDADAAERWLDTQLPDPRLDRAAAAVVRARYRSDPAAALGWAERIEREEIRARNVQLVARFWWRSDPQAVNAWLADGDLPEDLLEQVRAAQNRPATGPRREPTANGEG
jgi:hypothetical protein